MQPQIGDEVIALHLVGATLTTDTGVLGVELDGEEHVIGIVLATDGGATYIPSKFLVRLTAREN